MSNANIALVQSLYAAFGKGDIGTLVSGLTADVDWNVNGRRKDYPMFGSWKGPSDVQTFFQGVGENETFSAFSPNEFHAAGDLVFAFGHYAGAVKKTGKPFDCKWVHVFTVKMARSRAFANSPTPRSSLKPIGAERQPYRVSGPQAFFQASMPPWIWQALVMPESCAAWTAIAERSPNAQ